MPINYDLLGAASEQVAQERAEAAANEERFELETEAYIVNWWHDYMADLGIVAESCGVTDGKRFIVACGFRFEFHSYQGFNRLLITHLESDKLYPGVIKLEFSTLPRNWHHKHRTNLMAAIDEAMKSSYWGENITLVELSDEDGDSDDAHYYDPQHELDDLRGQLAEALDLVAFTATEHEIMATELDKAKEAVWGLRENLIKAERMQDDRIEALNSQLEHSKKLAQRITEVLQPEIVGIIKLVAEQGSHAWRNERTCTAIFQLTAVLESVQYLTGRIRNIDTKDYTDIPM